MTKSELIEQVAKKADITKSNAEKAVNAVTETITLALTAGDKVTLTGFGTFEAKFSQGRKGRNPRTGESIDIPARTVAKFKPGKDLKEAVK